MLYVVACGGYTAGELEGFIRRLQEQGWEVCVIATPSALKFMDTNRLEDVTGRIVRSDFKQPDEPDILPAANAVAVVPATFNTINKWVNGSSDTLALGVLHEAVGLELPIVVAPTLNTALAKHPAFVASVATLRSWGVRVLFDPATFPLPEPRKGLTVTDFFPWSELEAALLEMRNAVS
jgi:phosphopantothenoylcysteine synthetase/decarboxylase